MRKWTAGAVVALIALLASLSSGQMLGAGGHRPAPSIGQQQFSRLAKNYGNVPKVYTDARPRVCIIVDDGRANAFDPAQRQLHAFAAEGLHVGFSLNYDNIGSSSTFATEDEINAVIDTFEARGAGWSILQHGNSNFDPSVIYPGSATAGYASLVAEVDPSALETAFGRRPTLVVIPGDVGRQEWYRRSINSNSVVFDSLRYVACFVGGSSAYDSTSVSDAFFRQPATDGQTTESVGGEVGTAYPGFYRPGMAINRWAIIRPTWDLGVFVVERGVGQTLSSASPWCIIDPNGDGIIGEGTDPKANGVYSKPIWHPISAALSQNRGFAFVWHDSVATNTALSISGITGDERNGNFSPHHAAKMLRALEDAGELVVVSPEEYVEWISGQYAYGTDLIDNPDCSIPQFAIGDTVGWASEYPFPRGISNAAANRQILDATWTNQFVMGHFSGGFTIAEAGAKFSRTSGQHPADFIGAGVSGWRGRPGGMHFNGSGPRYLKMIFGGLPSGRYRFSIARTGGQTITVDEMHFAAAIKAFKLETSWELGGAPAYTDTLLSWRWRDSSVSVSGAGTGSAAQWYDLPIEFYLPEYPAGDAFDSIYFGREVEGDGTGAGTPLLFGTTDERIWIDSIQWTFTLLIDNATLNTTYSRPMLVWEGPR